MTEGKTKKNSKSKQDKFCIEYIKDFNGQKAAERAGYASKNARVTASNLLTKINIKNKINSLLEKAENQAIVQIPQIVAELSKIAFSDIQDFVSFLETGNLDDIKGYTEVIQEITVTHNAKGDKNYKLKLCSKEKALELLGKYKAIFTEKIQHSGDISAMSKEDIQDAIRAAAAYENRKKKK